MIAMFLKLKSIWGKWNWLICLVLLAFSVYKVFEKPDVTEKKVVDTTTVTQLEQANVTISTLRTELKKSKQYNIKTDEEIKETYDPVTVKIIGRFIQKRKIDTSTSTSSNSSNSTETSSSTVVASSKTVTHEEDTRTTDANKRFVGGGYLFNNQTVLIQCGYDITKTISVSVVGTYDFKSMTGIDRKWDVGAVILKRY